jgi:hypothetical protein
MGGIYILRGIIRAMCLMTNGPLTAKVPEPMADTALDPTACSIRMQIRTPIDWENPPTADPMTKI